MSLTFKENCGDLRNSKVIDVKAAFDASALTAAGLRLWRL